MSIFKNIYLLIFFIMAGLLFTHFGCKKAAPPPEPNVVLIVIDTLRADHLPFYGYQKNTAPFLSQMASQSVVFEQAISASSWTAPATASIVTGLMPFQHGIVNGYYISKGFKLELNRIPNKVQTIAELLKENGYKTYAVSDNINICRAMGFHQGFDRFQRFLYKDEKKMDQTLMKWSKEIKANKKYFLYIHYNDVHAPFHPREPWYQKSDKFKENLISLYDSEINYLDEKIKKMYHHYGWDKNTLVIVVADHGEELWDHDKVGHGFSLFQEVVRVPFLIYFPERHQSPKRITTKVSNMDVMPTIQHYLQLKSSQAKTGINLMPLIKSGDTGAGDSRYIFSHLILSYQDKLKNQMVRATFKSIVNDKWKYIFRFKEETGTIFRRQLFNLDLDPGEKNNIYEENKKVASRLVSKYLKFEKNCKRYQSKKSKPNLDKEKMDELRTLGYVK
jgi:choline-sulfatase